MYYIITYDVGVERIDSIRKFLKLYLNWVQNSVFEGELTKSQFHIVKETLSSLIEEDHDNILIYQAMSQKLIERESLGSIKGDTDNII